MPLSGGVDRIDLQFNPPRVRVGDVRIRHLWVLEAMLGVVPGMRSSRIPAPGR